MAECKCPMCGKFIPGVFGFCSERCYQKRFNRMALLERKIRQAKRQVSLLRSLQDSFQSDICAGVKERK